MTHSGPDTLVQLGDFTFFDEEIPEEIIYGGKQRVTVHKLLGGARVIDSMGPDDMEINWSGWFLGQDAIQRASTLDSMRRSGASVSLQFGGLSWTVVITDFMATYQRFYQIPYKISCTVVTDDAQAISNPVGPTMDDQMVADSALAQEYATRAAISEEARNIINDPIMGAYQLAVDTFNASVIFIDPFLTTSADQLALVKSQVLVAMAYSAPGTWPQGSVASIPDSLDAQLAAPPNFADVNVGDDPDVSASNLIAMSNINDELFAVLTANALAGRMYTNLAGLGA